MVECVNIDEDTIKKIYKFWVLFPNGEFGLKIRDPETEMPMEEFIEFVKGMYFRAMRQSESQRTRRRINWKSSELRFVIAFDNGMGSRINFENFKPQLVSHSKGSCESLLHPSLMILFKYDK